MNGSPVPLHDQRRPRARRLAAALAGGGILSSLLIAGPVADVTSANAADSELGARFTLAVLPDTQFYSRYSASQFQPRYGTDPFAVQTAWLAEHRDELNIPFVTHLGDVVDQVNTAAEWVAADAAMDTLDEAGLPYSILAGNHDVRNSADDHFDDEYDLAAEPFLQNFPVSRAEATAGFGGADPTGFNRFHTFEAAGEEFLVLSLSWRASDATLAWAQGVLDAHPTLPVILTTHALLNIEADGVSPRPDANGQRLWDKLIRGNDQIFLTFNGHFHGSTQETALNDAGNPVTQVLMDYQMAYEGGNGYLGLVEFDLTDDVISVQTGSPWVVSKPTETLTSYDQALLEEPNQQYEIPIDFAERFAGFAPDWTAGPADQPSLTQRARDILLDGFEGPDPVALEQPGSEDDFVQVDGTIAHWRFGDETGVVAEGQTFEDIAGDSDLHRVPIAESGSSTAQLADVTVTDDVHPFSSDPGAIDFAASDKRADRFSYLATEAGAAANSPDLAEGYTIETFLKIDPAWTADANGWMKAVVRSGNRSKLEGMPWSRWDYTASPAALGLSNLKEFQWTEVPLETTKGDRTAWSGEIILDRWVHVALINDPDARTTTMYVDGAPVLRNTVDTLGQSVQPEMPWIFGADFVDDAAANGWIGSIGETRVIDHPTSADEWLTARPELSGLTSDAPSGDIAPGDAPDALTGSGTPGATVTLAGTLSGTAVVGEDGTWSLPLDAAEPGRYELSLVQGFGTRLSEPLTGAFTVLAAVPPVEGPGTGTPGTGAPGTGADAAPVASDSGPLATTGVDTAAAAGLTALAVLLLGLGAVLVQRRRLTASRQSD